MGVGLVEGTRPLVYDELKFKSLLKEVSICSVRLYL